MAKAFLITSLIRWLATLEPRRHGMASGIILNGYEVFRIAKRIPNHRPGSRDGQANP